MLRRENQGDLFDDQVVLPSLESVLTGISSSQRCDDRTTYFSAPDVDLSLYDHIIVCLSGGKDSIAAYLRLVDMGVDKSKVEFWHHDVDGQEGSSLMDWAFMRDYCRQLGEELGIPMYFS
ncbi:phosphohydrolase, partial [Salmonella enterica]|nr:phosphohydrolase [Salmonella enterica subsp. enterica serovar Dublin]EGS2321240.1 phosphohydrolase [Salmonella enterica subsp. enterica serovar Dublin]MEB3649281.1 phosphohydrolase [Salmonella enterica]